jgi:hypothetical protein
MSSPPRAAGPVIADPYPRYVVAREKVNQGAAVRLMSVAAARRLGSDADPVLIELLAAAPEPVGERVYVRSSEAGNQVTVS